MFMHVLFPGRKYERLKGEHLGNRVAQKRCEVSGIPAQGFRLSVEVSAIYLEAADEPGLFYGWQALADIFETYHDKPIPCCRLEDWPDFKHRGYMLDISRDRVPTMAHLYHLVDHLAKLRYNQLQLYTEHTFAYSGHEKVWENASPMTADEIRDLDRYCRERHIELVPNQNSFGHMERWLEHDAYKHLAECPEGFRHPLSGVWRSQGSVIKPDARSLEFLDGLYAELLPNFSSRKFNIGGDEPWELGWGASSEKVKTEGKHKVYADFLARICQLATEHGAEPMCWADVLLEEPTVIDLLPETICPILWGYEADHPFEEQCAALAALGRDFCVAPGDSTWTSYTGRVPTMLANVRSAARIGKKFGASGLLMTHWGDNGHPQTWPVSLPGLVWAGLQSWNHQIEEKYLDESLRYVLGDRNGLYVQTLFASGKVDEALGVQLVNKSFLAQANLLPRTELDDFKLQPSESSMRQVKRDCENWIDVLPNAELSRSDAADLLDELKLALCLNHYAAARFLGEAEVASEELRALYRRCWHYRSRSGGLEDSLAKIQGLKL